jgi:hypothetical protein
VIHQHVAVTMVCLGLVGCRLGARVVGQRKGLFGKADKKVDVTMSMVIDGQRARGITWCVEVDAGKRSTTGSVGRGLQELQEVAWW